MHDIFYDLRTSIRNLVRRPFYPLVALVILVIGLSAGIAVFTYINGFYQPFPGVDAGGLVRVFHVEKENPYQNLSWLDFVDYAEGNDAFEGLAAIQPYYAASVRLEHLTEVAFLEAVSGDTFTVLGIETAIGRGLLADDDRAEATPVAVLSHAWWLRTFNGDPAVIGRTIYLNYRPFELVGVAAPEFRGTSSDFRPHVWIPLAPFRDRYVSWARQAENRDVPLVRVYGRLRAGVRQERGLAELESVAAGLDETYPRAEEPRRLRLDVANWIDPRARIAELPTVRLMMAAAGGLLLLVCANVANLLLSVAAGRQRDISMRSALGASPWRLLRQVLVENMVLAVMAGGIALFLAVPLTTRLGSYFARPSVWGANVAREASLDMRVVLFAIAISLITGVVAGLLPALRASRRSLMETLKSGADLTVAAPRTLGGRRIPGANDVLVAAQIALSVVLLVFAGLVVRTFISVSDLDPGFRFDPLVVTHISTSSTDIKEDGRERFFREVAEKLAAEPWVRAATVADFPLLSPHPTVDLRLDGQTDPVSLVFSRVIPGFFEAMEIDVLLGRSFEVRDTKEGPDVAIVNEALARRFFAGDSALGRRIWWPGSEDMEERAFEIVGVVRDTKTRDFLAEIEPTVYFSYPQHPYPTGSALLMSALGDPAAAVPRLQSWLREYERHLAIINVVTYREVVRGYVYTHRMNAEMFSALAALGLGLAAVGIFSVLSLAVSRRTREIGIRMSIGAERGDIGRLMIRRAMLPVALGLAVGLPAAFVLTELVQSLLYGVEPTDPFTLATGTGVLLAAALAAAYLPARRAARVDPVTALRRES